MPMVRCRWPKAFGRLMNESSRPQRHLGRLRRPLRSLITLETPMGVFDVYLARRPSRVRAVVIDRTEAPRARDLAPDAERMSGVRRRREVLSWGHLGLGLQLEP
jgi:hypothetical protein